MRVYLGALVPPSKARTTNEPESDIRHTIRGLNRCHQDCGFGQTPLPWYPLV